MSYTKLKAEIEQVKEWIANAGDADTVEVHCAYDVLSAMEEELEELETMLSE